LTVVLKPVQHSQIGHPPEKMINAEFRHYPVTALARINRRLAQGLSLSPDGRTLIWSQVERDVSDLMFADGVR
jgi:hypothetical protein